MSNELGDYLKKVRKEKGLTHRELSKLSGISFAYISQIETGSRGIPTPDILRALSDPLGVSYGDLMHKAGYLEGISSEDRIKRLEEDLKAANVRIMELEQVVSVIRKTINTIK